MSDNKSSSKEPSSVVTNEVVNNQTKLQKTSMQWMDGKAALIATFIATVWALFATDIYMASGAPIDADIIVYTITFIAFIIFIGEWAILTWAQPGYRWSFFFFLDLVAWLSLIPDVLLLFQDNASQGGGASVDQLTVARAGRAARAGTRAARIVRIFKLLSVMKKKKEKDKLKKGKVTPIATDDDEDFQFSESKIGSKLADGITQKVIVIVALMLVTTSFLELISVDQRSSWTEALEHMEIMHRYARDAPAGSQFKMTDFNDYVKLNYLDEHGSLIRVLVINGQDYKRVDFSDLRASPSEEIAITLELDAARGTGESKIILENKSLVQQQSLANFFQMLFIVVLLGATSWLFGRDSDSLIIHPLERMTRFVYLLSKNPLRPIKDDVVKSDMETDFVEAALRKFVSLLQVGFGEAGAMIIGKNIQAGAKLNAMIPGVRMQAIFGFCYIFDFNDATECLEDKVMLFVNTIGKYVHNAVKGGGGAPNKNMGDAFLLVWRIDESHEDPKLCDKALKSFIEIIHATTSCLELKELTDDARLQRRLPGYSVKMGFGLHRGWAIEGAIGSDLKIDASYLSPNVNMSARLEAATKQYGVPILLSEAVYDGLTPKTKNLVRKVDRVTVKGSKNPIDFYTYDVPLTAAKPGAMGDASTYEDEVEQFYAENPPRTTQQHRAQFAQGMQHYLDGDWPAARDSFDYCLAMESDDPPAKTLLSVMSDSIFKAPDNWPGFRELTEK